MFCEVDVFEYHLAICELQHSTQLDPISFTPFPGISLLFFVVPTSERVLMGGETFEVGGLRVSSFLLALPHLLDDLKGLVVVC